MEFNHDYTKQQLQEFEMAEQFGGSSAVIRKHPEWHSNFMNVFWNREKEGKEAGLYEIADYMASHPSNQDVQDRKIGADFEYLSALSRFMDASNGTLKIPNIPLGDDGCVDTEKAKFMLLNQTYRFIEHREPLFTGRTPLGLNDNTYDTKILMCEGDKEAMRIYDQLEAVAKAGLKNGFSGPDSYDMRHMNALNAVLSLDDMNIRGRQITDAYAYADYSIEKMLDCLDMRDAQMAAYVNQETAKRFLNDKPSMIAGLMGDKFGRMPYPMAKTGGRRASMAHSGHPGFSRDTDWQINVLNANDFSDANIKPMEVDYSKLDVTDGVNLETGIRIIEAHGFERYFDRPTKSVFGDDKRMMFFVNRHNGDIVEVSGALEDDIAYAGVTLRVWRDRDNWHHANYASSGFNHEAQLGYAEFSYQNGLFAEYGSYQDLPVEEQQGRDKIGFCGIGKFPIPEYIQTFARDNDLYDALQDKGNFQALSSDNCYWLKWMANMMLAAHDPEIKEDICPDYRQLKDNPYKYVMEKYELGWGGLEEHAQRFQFIASWTHMPTDERGRYYEALVEAAYEHDEHVKGNAEKIGRRVDKNELYSEDVKKLSSMYLKDPKCPDDIYAIGVPRIEETPFAEFLPWLGQDLTFEDAIASISENQPRMGR